MLCKVIIKGNCGVPERTRFRGQPGLRSIDRASTLDLIAVNAVQAGVTKPLMGRKFSTVASILRKV